MAELGSSNSFIFVSDQQWSVAIFGLSLTLSLCFCFIIYPRFLGDNIRLDPDGYGAAGRVIYEEQRFTSTSQAPFYPAFIASVSFLIGGYRVDSIQVAQCILLAITVVIMDRIFLKTIKKREARWASLICAVFPLLIWYSPRLWTEVFLIFMVACYSYVLIRFFQGPKSRLAFFLGIVVASTALSKGIALTFVIVTPLAMFLKYRKSGLRWIILFLTTAILCYTPWILRNWQLTGDILMAQSNAGANMLLGNGFTRNWLQSPFSYVALKSKTIEDHKMILDKYARPENPVVYDNFLMKTALHEFQVQPTLILQKLVVQSLTYWYLAADSSKSILTGSLQIPFVILAIFGALAAWRQKSEALLLLIPIVGIMGGSVLVFAFARLAVPVIPYIIGLAVFGVASLRRKMLA